MKRIQTLLTTLCLILSAAVLMAQENKAPLLTVRPGVFKEFQWPTPITLDKFKRQMDHTALGLNIVKLTPSMETAAVQWPDGSIVNASFANGRWDISNGKEGQMTKAASIEGDEITMACCGTAVLFKDKNGECTFVQGGISNIQATLALPKNVNTPVVTQLYIGGYGVLYCLAMEAERELEQATKLYQENMEYIKARWSNSTEWHWKQKIEFYKSSLTKLKNECVEATQGFIPTIVADPILRDRYSGILYLLTSQYTSSGGYLGGEFRNNYYKYYSGRGEVVEAMRFAQRLVELVSRARRIYGAPFKEGVASGTLLAAGWASPLADVPRRAGLPSLASTKQLRMFKGEAESAILVLSSGAQPIEGIELSITPNTPNAPQVQIYRVEYITLEASGAPQLPFTKGGDEQVADICIPMKAGDKISLPPYSNQPLFFNFIAPENSTSGDFTYECTIKPHEGAPITLPIQTKVEKITPGYKRIKSIGGLNTKEIEKWYPEQYKVPARKNLASAMLECKIGPLGLYMWGAPSPLIEDIPELLKKGLDGVVLSSGLCGLVDPAKDLVEYVELYGSKDGIKFEKLPSKTRYDARKSEALDAMDLIVTPESSLADYRYIKIHSTKEKNQSQQCQSFLIRASAPPFLELTYQDGTQAPQTDSVRYIQPDKKPERGAFSTANPIVETLFFDSYRPGSNRPSVLIDTEGKNVTSIRLFNRRASSISANIKQNYKKLRDVVGDEMTVYVYGFDEANETENANLREALIRTKKLVPGVKTITTAANVKVNMDLYELLDIHCPSNANSMPRLHREIHKKYGTEFWTYVGGGGYYPFGNFERVDQPRINSRAFLWSMICFDYISGFLYWDIDCWGSNRSMAKDEYFDWTKWNPSHGDHNGMGAIFYPGPKGDIYPSLRAWTLRDGIEDVNAFRFATELLRAHPNVDKQVILDEIGRGFAQSHSIWCHEIDTMKLLRDRLYDLIQELHRQ
ncbi:MAG: DUF4091 domain-containing protein [Victivallales bacterium]|nr:DUF4091 domain-containing protein [Victivallales bacterium]